MAAMGSLKAFQTQMLKKLDNHSGQKLKYEQFLGGFNDGINEETWQSSISEKKSEGDMGPGPMGRKLQINIMQQWLHFMS